MTGVHSFGTRTAVYYPELFHSPLSWRIGYMRPTVRAQSQRILNKLFVAGQIDTSDGRTPGDKSQPLTLTTLVAWHGITAGPSTSTIQQCH